MVKSAVDQLAVMADRDDIFEGTDYRIYTNNNSVNLLAIRFKKIYPSFKIYADKTSYEGDRLDEKSYNSLFDECSYVLGKNIGVKFGKETQKCLCIDISKARECGINLDGFISTPG